MKAKEPDAWIELDSDPGLFTLLLEDIGEPCSSFHPLKRVKGVDVEDVYDFKTSYDSFLDRDVFGFVFLFKWNESGSTRSGGRRKSKAKEIETSSLDPAVTEGLFFAHQKITNSCATHAILQIVLNCLQIEIGDMLQKLRSATANLNPEDKGWYIDKIPELHDAHRKHATASAVREFLADPDNQSRSSGSSLTGTKLAEAFHFVSFVPFNGYLLELDGLKAGPKNLGPICPEKPWKEMLRENLEKRIPKPGKMDEEIRFNLMALVPCDGKTFRDRLELQEQNRNTLAKCFSRVENLSLSDIIDSDAVEASSVFLHRQIGECSIAVTEDSLLAADQLNLSFGSVDSFQGFSLDSTDDPLSNDISPSLRSCHLNDEVIAVLDGVCPNSSQLEDKLVSASNAVSVRLRLVDNDEWRTLSLKEALEVHQKLQTAIVETRKLLDAENAKHTQYKVEDARRTFDYDPFIRTFLGLLVEHEIISLKEEESSEATQSPASAKRRKKRKIG